MIGKKREFPLKILFKHAAIRRLPPNHKKVSMIEVELAQDHSGYKGEKLLDYYLRTFHGPDIRIYNDLRFDDGDPFQMDSFILTPYFSFIIDSKNIDGETSIDTLFQQSIQKNTYGEQRRLSNPITQIKRHTFLMMEWFQKHGYYSIPIEAVVANCNPAGILKADSNNPLIAQKILNVELIPNRIEELRKKYTKKMLNESDLAALHKFILSEHTPPTYDLEKLYGISPNEILKGVQCPKCQFLGMKRLNRFWLCPKCGEKSTSAHEQAIFDYFLLIKTTMTVAECCEFLGIDSRHVAKRLLQSMKLRATGKTRGRIYHSPWSKAQTKII